MRLTEQDILRVEKPNEVADKLFAELMQPLLTKKPATWSNI